MKTPGTIAFMLRWQPLNTIGGLVFACLGGYELWTYKPVTDPSTPYTAGVDIFGPPLFVLVLIVGAAALARAWWNARRLRNGG